MKRKLILPAIACLFLIAFYSFSLIKPGHNKPLKKDKAVKQFSCSAVVTSVTGVYNGPYSITITWTYTGSPSYFTYGGNFYCATGVSWGTGTTSSTSTTITIPSNAGCEYSGINGRIIPYCADGTAGTAKVFSVTH